MLFSIFGVCGIYKVISIGMGIFCLIGLLWVGVRDKNECYCSIQCMLGS